MSKPLVLVTPPPAQVRHFSPGHPECPERLKTIVNHLKNGTLWDSFEVISPREATEDDVLRVHSTEHWNKLQRSEGRSGWHDPDSYFGPDSFQAAIEAAGAGLTAIDAMISGKANRAMALVRPPGHHATRDETMGFCHLNNIAIAARYLQSVHGLGNVAIIDFDVHHGNGTQDIFENDDSVFFLSLHQWPLWPMSGLESETGWGAGIGMTRNKTLPPGTTGDQVVQTLERNLDFIEEFQPEAILISAGFDGHRDDPIGAWQCEATHYELMTRAILDAGKRVGVKYDLSMLEGGYNVHALAESVEAHLSAMIEA